ncbi:AraC family transcriptional regulator [Cryobacterium adonitolivorans]|uniref:AraC family transcriptional regulator n=1 Tax=Cryobacterium adonitolivorans TaxID=1259189 RepID=A0A4R8W6I6_9MICO|nr:GyrI-like domain-containing protein [Cryobacterium adonitolivorans]TFC01699.1 AraC family transcriptional regulator [Cryobacterium adonitolivorans]
MQIDRVELEPRTLLGVHERVMMADLTEYFGRAFEVSAAALAAQGLAPAGPPVALYHGMPTDSIDVTAGFPIVGPAQATAGVVVTELPAGAAIASIYTGPYDGMTRTYDQIAAWLREHNLTPRVDMWEEYLAGPETNPDPATWQTRIVFPLA